jgi:hypothetical protein
MSFTLFTWQKGARKFLATFFIREANPFYEGGASTLNHFPKSCTSYAITFPTKEIPSKTKEF